MEKQRTLESKIAELRTVVNVKKKGFNKFSKFNYYQIDDIYSEMKSGMHRIGISTSVRFEKVEEEYLAKLIVADGINRDIEYHIIIKWSTMKGMTPAQESGTMITYATKYLYGLMLGLDDGANDPDSKDGTSGSENTSHNANTNGFTASKQDDNTMGRTELRDALSGFSADQLKEYGISNIKLAIITKLQAAYKGLVK